ncbi:alpha/beta-hydrolase [Coprinellus micaceus]|uniref:Alpha/beta-hydrolase n=1 Tax=Coprinellus micaceus TaxID=71717 RepID=A0A4Y7TIM1_COPMI|nr:alpha/beta-hydrolase [Coprinellus micaceus]
MYTLKLKSRSAFKYLLAGLLVALCVISSVEGAPTRPGKAVAKSAPKVAKSTPKVGKPTRKVVKAAAAAREKEPRASQRPKKKTTAPSGKQRLVKRTAVTHPAGNQPAILFHGTKKEYATSAQKPDLKKTHPSGDLHHNKNGCVEGGMYLTDSVIAAAQYVCHRFGQPNPDTAYILKYQWTPPAGVKVHTFPADATPDDSQCGAHDMVTSAMHSLPWDKDLTTDFWQYAIVKQNVMDTNLKYLETYVIPCANVHKGADLDADDYIKGQGANPGFTAIFGMKQRTYYGYVELPLKEWALQGTPMLPYLATALVLAILTLRTVTVSTTSVTEGYLDFIIPSTTQTAQTWYKVIGHLKSDSHPLIALHGGPGIYSGYLEILCDITERGQEPLILYDMQVGNTSFWTEELFLAELDNVLEKLNVTKYDVIGHSWGGMLGARHATHQPLGLQKLVLMSAPASIPLYIEGIQRLRAALPEDIKQALDKHESDGTTDDPEYQDADPTVYSTMWGPNEFTAAGVLKNWSVVDDISKITVPTLLTNGGQDEVTDPCLGSVR